MTTPADELNAAAERLRKLAGQATEGPWETTWRDQQHHLDGYRDGDLHPIAEWTYDVADKEPKATEQRAECNTADADYIATMHPGVGLAIAKWLDSFDGIDISEHAAMSEDVEHALAVARLINQEGT